MHFGELSTKLLRTVVRRVLHGFHKLFRRFKTVCVYIYICIYSQACNRAVKFVTPNKVFASLPGPPPQTLEPLQKPS